MIRQILNVPLAVAITVTVLAFALATDASIHPGLAGAQANDLKITAVDSSAWPSLEATVTVVDPSGQPITGLAPEAFRATVGGSNLAITGLRTTSDPGTGVAVVLAFDVSGSMQGAPLESARAAGQELVAQLGASDQAAVIAFSDQPVVIQPFTADKAVLSTAIGGLALGGNTSLYAAVQESIRIASEAPLARRAVVLLSDGYDFGGPAVDPSVPLASVANSSVLFISIGLGDEVDQDFLSQLASAGRGQFRLAPAPADLTSLYQDTAEVLRQQYVVTLSAAAIAADAVNGAPLRIEVNAGGGVLSGESALTLPPSAFATPVIPITAAPEADVEAPTPRLPVATGKSSSSSPIAMYAALAGAGGMLLVGGAFLWQRRRRAIPAVAEAEGRLERFQRPEQEVSFPTIHRAVPMAQAKAWLTLSSGELVPLTDDPVTVGFGTDCLVRLGKSGESSRTERARIWRRDGNYMLHNLSRVGGISIAGRPVTWAVLEDGDEILIGGQTVVFSDAPPLDPPKI